MALPKSQCQVPPLIDTMSVDRDIEKQVDSIPPSPVGDDSTSDEAEAISVEAASSNESHGSDGGKPSWRQRFSGFWASKEPEQLKVRCGVYLTARNVQTWQRY